MTIKNHKHIFVTKRNIFFADYPLGTTKNHRHQVTVEDVQKSTTISVGGDMKSLGDERVAFDHSHKMELSDGTEIQSLLLSDIFDVEVTKSLDIGMQSIIFSEKLFTFESAVRWMEENNCDVSPNHERRHDEIIFTCRTGSMFEEFSLRRMNVIPGVDIILGFFESEESMQLALTEVEAEEIFTAEQLNELECVKDEIAEELREFHEILSNINAVTESVKDEIVARYLPTKLVHALVTSTAIPKVLESVELLSCIELESCDAMKALKESLTDSNREEFEETLLSVLSDGVEIVKSLRESFEDTTFEKFFSALGIVQNQLENISFSIEVLKALTPTSEMSRAQLEASRKERAERFGIEITENSNLTFQKGDPTDLDLFGDPVNLKFPFDTIERARNARVRFKQFADKIYKLENSKRVVHTRIVRRQLDLNVIPGINPTDRLDALLPQSLRDEAVAVKKDEHTAGEVGVNSEGSSTQSFIPQEWVKVVKSLNQNEEEERTVLGVVMEPDVTDMQGDTFTAEVIRETAWDFMENVKKLGLMHVEILGNNQIAILESYIAPVDFELQTDSGEIFKVKKGTWLVRARIVDDLLWQDIKEGRLTGFSLAGKARAIDLEKHPEFKK